jgi:DeoR/GlpR family transcriptional regulator of sugar metabolism
MDTVEIYRYILEYYKRHMFVPTVRDMSDHFQCSTSTVHLRLKELEEKGDIIRKKDGSLYRLRNEIMLDLISHAKNCVECGQCDDGECVFYIDEE